MEAPGKARDSLYPQVVNFCMMWHAKFITWLRTRWCWKYSSVWQRLSGTLIVSEHSDLETWWSGKGGISSLHFVPSSSSTQTPATLFLWLQMLYTWPWATLPSMSYMCAMHATLAGHLEVSGYSGIRITCSLETCQLKIRQLPLHTISVLQNTKKKKSLYTKAKHFCG